MPYKYRKDKNRNGRQWKLKNKDKVRNSYKRYWEENKDIIKKSHRKYYMDNKEKVLAKIKAYKQTPKYKLYARISEKNRRQKLRYEVLSHYSGGQPFCNICGYSDMRALALDHINNDGYEERKQLGRGKQNGSSSTMFYNWVKKNNFPPRYQVLCHNCNFLKRLEGK